MAWFGRRKKPPDETMSRREQEFNDPYDRRASVTDGSSIMVDPGKVRDNVALAIERLDLDIDTAISIEDDVVALEELAMLVRLGAGPLLIADVVNTAVRVMLARYPEELVRGPLPAEYDLRVLFPHLQLDDEPHRRAKMVFNRRLGVEPDLEPGDHHLGEQLDDLDEADQVQVFTAVFFIVGSRIGALKSHTGID